MPVADEVRCCPAFVGLAGARDFEIENAYAITGLAFVGSAVTGADHDALLRSFLAAKINHRVSDRRVALDAVGPGPEKKIAGNEFVEFEGVFLAAVDRPESSRFAQPDILLARIARHIANAILRQHVNDKPGAIHPTVCRIRRPVLVIEIPRRQLERGIDDLAHVCRIILITGYVPGRDGGRRSFFLGGRRR